MWKFYFGIRDQCSTLTPEQQQLRLCSELSTHGALTSRELAQRTGLELRTINRRLRELVQQHAVVKIQRGHSVYYFLKRQDKVHKSKQSRQR